MLDVRNLTCTRGGLPVISGLTMSLGVGEAAILRGPNGSGKTTLLRTLAGLQPAAGGEIRVDSETIAYAGHADGIKATLTVRENLSFWASIFGTGDIGPALAAFDLAELADRAAGSLSAGQKRRLGLARLGVTGRPLWLLDEPTVSLDAASTDRFGAAVRAHLAGGGAALIATHIDLGLDAPTLDLAQYRAAAETGGAFGEAFL